MGRNLLTAILVLSAGLMAAIGYFSLAPPKTSSRIEQALHAEKPVPPSRSNKANSLRNDYHASFRGEPGKTTRVPSVSEVNRKVADLREHFTEGRTPRELEPVLAQQEAALRRKSKEYFDAHYNQLDQRVGFSVDLPLANTETPEKEISKLIRDHPALFGVAPGGLVTTVRQPNRSSSGIQTYHVTQSVDGLPVWGETIKVTAHSGKISGINGRFAAIPEELNTTRSIGQDKLARIIRTHKGRDSITIDFSTLEEGVLVWNQQAFHVYRVEVKAGLLDYELAYININSDRWLTSNSLVYTSSAASSGKDLLGNTINFFSTFSDNVYELLDTESLAGLVEENYVGEGEECESIESLEPHAGWDEAGISAVSNAMQTARYYADTHDRDSYDDRGGRLRSCVNLIYSRPDGSETGENASWHPDINTMNYGAGGSGTRNFAASLDVAGHEMTHGVVHYSSSLVYRNQSGALNESFADFFGAMIDRDDWLMGEDLYTDGRFIRSLSTPERGGQPSHFSNYVNLPHKVDNGGVHVNSGIPNRALYLLAEGLRDEGLGQSIGRNKTEELAYDTMIALGSYDEFEDAVVEMILKAEARYGADSQEVRSVKRAWTLVGLYGEGFQPDQQPDDIRVPLQPGDDVLIFSTPRDGTLEPDDVYSESYDLYAVNANQPYGGFNSNTLRGPLNGKPATSVRASVAVIFRDWSIVAYKATDGILYFADTFGVFLDYPLDFGIEVARMAFSPNGDKIALVFVDSTIIWVCGFFDGTDCEAHYVVGPSYSEEESVSFVRRVDAINFDYASRQISFDYEACFSDDSSNCSGVWNIGILDLTTGFSYPFPNLGEDIELGFPQFSNIGRPELVFDVFDFESLEETGEVFSYIYKYNLLDREGVLVSQTKGEDANESFAYPGWPAFVGNDQAVTFHAAFEANTFLFQRDLDTNYQPVEPYLSSLQQLVPYDAGLGQPYRNATGEIHATLDVSETSHDFGEILQGDVEKFRLVLSNTGNRKIEITHITLTAALSTDLTNTTMLPGEERTVSLVLDSAESGRQSFSGQLRIVHDGDNPDITIGLSASILIDTDGDGLHDGIDTDDDNDGLSDAEEAELGTDPLRQDTDGDGWDDYLEVSVGSNPLEQNCPAALCRGGSWIYGTQ